MGFIKATIKAVGGTLKDQWKEAIRCENMANNVLMIRKTTKDRGYYKWKYCNC